MSIFIRSVLIAVALLSSVSAASARYLEDNSRSPSSYDFNNPDDVKAFWEAQQRNGG